MVFRTNEIIRTNEIQLVFRSYEILIRMYELVFRTYELVCRLYEILIRLYELVFRSYEILIFFLNVPYTVSHKGAFLHL